VWQEGCRPHELHPDDRRAQLLCEMTTADAEDQRAKIETRCRQWPRQPANSEIALAVARTRFDEGLALLTELQPDCAAAKGLLSAPGWNVSIGRNHGRGSWDWRVPNPSLEAMWPEKLRRVRERFGNGHGEPAITAVQELVRLFVVESCHLVWRVGDLEPALRLCERAESEVVRQREALGARCAITQVAPAQGGELIEGPW
jgi:hypothetical protein